MVRHASSVAPWTSRPRAARSPSGTPLPPARHSVSFTPKGAEHRCRVEVARRGWSRLTGVERDVAASRTRRPTARRPRRKGRFTAARPDPSASRWTTVTASDGVRLYVEESGPPDAAVTLVFVHGFCMTADAWLFQRRGLADLGRTVCYDQRAHGRSGPSEPERCTIAQLADDLRRVLDDRVPTGQVVLVGHSMGGMTILGLAEACPELFGERIIAVALLSTSAGELPRLAFGLPAAVGAAARRVLPGMAVGLRHAPSLLERARWKGGTLSRTLTRRLGFGAAQAP